MKKNSSIEPVTRIVETYGGDYQRQIRELKRLVREGQRSGDFVMVGAAYCCLTEAGYAIADLNTMLSSALKAVALLKDTDEYQWIARSYAALGNAYTNQENNQMALINNEIAYEIVRKHRIKGQTRFKALNNLSVSYLLMGEVKTSIRLLNECIDLIRASADPNYTDLAKYSLNLAYCHMENKEPESAQAVLRSMASWIDRVEFSPVICDYYLTSAIVAYKLGDVPAGNECVDTAFTLIPKDVYPHPVYDNLREVGHFLSKNGDRARADKVFDLMTVYAEKNPGMIQQVFAVRMMADYFNQFGDYRRATEYYAKYEALNARHMRELMEMQLTLHKATRNAEIEIRRLKQRMRKNEELVSLDPMTKLLNRSGLLRVSSEFIDAAARKKQKVGVIFIDIDFFKECNDTYGHTRGDEIIQEVARACRKQEAENVRFARYGGDEFFGITLGLSDDEVTEVARGVSRTIRSADIPHEKNPNGGRITLSVGLVNVAITETTDTILQIANYADKAVYYAKNAGKNTIYRLDHGDPDAGESGSSFVKIDF